MPALLCGVGLGKIRPSLSVPNHPLRPSVPPSPPSLPRSIPSVPRSPPSLRPLRPLPALPPFPSVIPLFSSVPFRPNASLRPLRPHPFPFFLPRPSPNPFFLHPPRWQLHHATGTRTARESLQVGESGPMPRRANSWHSYGQSFHRAHFSSHLILFPPLLSRPLSPHSVASHMVMILVLSLAFSRCLTGFVPLVTPFPSPQPSLMAMASRHLKGRS